jgi:hypothetical protein
MVDAQHKTTDPLEPPDSRRRPRLHRRIAYRVLALLIAWVGIELGSTLILYLKGWDLPFSELRMERRRIADQKDWVALAEEEVLHPYTGYALNSDHLDYVNPYGFARMDEDLPKRGPHRLVVGVTGGSVALELCREGGETLRQRLQARFPDRKVVLNCMAVQGYRQPQQVMALTYLHFLGAEFDIVVNLDGFNEIALAPTEDPDGVTYDSFPRHWAVRVSEARRDPSWHATLTMQAAALRDARQRFAAFCSRSPWNRSPTLLLCWWLRNQTYELDLEHIGQQVQQEFLEHKHNLPSVITGPPNPDGDLAERLQRLADQWYRGSLQLNRICESSGARYVHVLQPNQYVPDSKPLSPDDRFSAGIPYQSLVVDGYPLLRQRGEKLAGQGIPFVDASLIFDQVTEPIYCDECCHLNRRGNELLAGFIADEIASRIER